MHVNLQKATYNRYLPILPARVPPSALFVSVRFVLEREKGQVGSAGGGDG